MLPSTPTDCLAGGSNGRGQQAAEAAARALLAAGGFDAARVREAQESLRADNSLLSQMFEDLVKGAGIDTNVAARPSSSNTSSSTSSRHQEPTCPRPDAGIRLAGPPQEQQQQQHGVKRSRTMDGSSSSTVRELPVTLEELFHGALKTVPVTVQQAGTTVVRELRVRVEPGLPEGERIILPGHGSAGSAGRPSDLTLVVHQQLHRHFTRRRDDLLACVSVPLVTALTGGPVLLRTLSGQLLQLPLQDGTIITPGSTLMLPGQGMPVFGASQQRGALHVRFSVEFPARLSGDQRAAVRHALLGLTGAGDAPPSVAAATAAGLLPQPQAGLRGALPAVPAAAAAAAAAQHEHHHQQQQEQE